MKFAKKNYLIYEPGVKAAIFHTKIEILKIFVLAIKYCSEIYFWIETLGKPPPSMLRPCYEIQILLNLDLKFRKSRPLIHFSSAFLYFQFSCA